MPLATNPQTGEAVYLTDDGQWAPARIAVNPQTKETLAFDGKAWTPLAKPSKGVLGYVDDAVRSVASGLTFGYADEIAAKMDELTGRGGSYEQNVARERARDREIPGAISIPGEIAGAVGSSLAAAPYAGALATASGLSRIPQAARYIAGGAGSGALFGSGSAEEGGRIQGAGVGGVLGAGAGLIAPKVANVAAKTVNAVRGAFSPQAHVATDLSRAIARDETTPQALIQRLGEAAQVRPGMATLADVGGENVKGLVERIAQTPGAGRTTIVPALTARQTGQMGRLSNDLSELTGTRQSATHAISEMMEQRATSAKPLYDEAFDFNAREAGEVVQAWNRITSTGWGQHIVRSPEFRRNLQTEYGIRDAASAPLMVQIDAWKKAADDIVGDSIRAGAGNRARVVSGMRDDLLSVVDRINPAYAKARSAWAGPSRYLDAIKEGRNILSTRASAEELAAAFTAMSDVEREAFRIGAVSAIQAKMGSDPARMADFTKYLRSPEIRAKVAAIMPTAEARSAWERRLAFEIESSGMTGRALGNSATARRLAERQDADNIVGDLLMDAFAGTPPTSLLRRFVSGVPKRIRDTLRSRSDDILAELLTDPQAMAGVQRALERVTQRGSPLRNGAIINSSNATIQ